MGKHREPDFEPYKRGSKRHDGGTSDALRKLGNLPVYPVLPDVRDWAIAMLAADLGLPVEVVRAHIDKLAEDM